MCADKSASELCNTVLQLRQKKHTHRRYHFDAKYRKNQIN